MLNLQAGLTALSILTAFWVFGAVAASSAQMFSVEQMRANGISRGIPYREHYGMWNDLVVIHPLIAVLTAILWDEWAHQWWLVPIIFASGTVSLLANNYWVQDLEVIQSHAEIAPDKVRCTGYMSHVGWIHVFHMALIVSGASMTAISAAIGQVPILLLVGAVLVFLGHAAMGQHPLLRVMNPSWNPFPRTTNDDLLLIAYLACTFMGSTLVFFYLLISFGR